MPLGDLIYDIGGGIPGGKEFKAAQIGGPSGGCIPKQFLNVRLDYESLAEFGAMIKDTSLCGLGQTAPNPVLSTIRHFGYEYIEHIRDKRCRAGVCPSLVHAPCESACPANVDIPGYVSLVSEKRYAEALRLHRDRNPFAAVCSRVCFHTCEDKCRRTTIDAPVSIRGIKRFMADQEVTIQLPEVLENEHNEDCELQALAAELGIREVSYVGEKTRKRVDVSTPALARDNGKCIKCRRCVAVCAEMQHVGALWPQNRGFNTVIGPAFNRDLDTVPCVQRGQRAAICPEGAITEKDQIEEVWKALDKPDNHVIVQTAPAIRAALGECFGYPPGTLVTGKMVAALRRLGFDAVFDTNFAADLTILEEGTEFLSRLRRTFVEKKPAALRTVYEVVTGRPLPVENLHVKPIVGLAGVKEASLAISGTLPDWKFLEGITVNVAVAHGLSNAEQAIAAIVSGRAPYHFVEVMTCPGGCIGGGGQPRFTDNRVREARIAAIYREDEGKRLRKSHENPDLAALYEQYLGKPYGEKSHHLLHTQYTARPRV